MVFLLDFRVTARIIHIVRDLIDHHYRHRDYSIVGRLPRQRRSTGETPRRTRILGRMKAVEKLLIAQGCRRIVYAAHSQGSVLVFEHLRVTAFEANGVGPTRAVVTFGSPLLHIYSQYFHAYDHLEPRLLPIAAGLHSWTNMYRLDDPIGAAISTGTGPIREIAMKRGVAGTRFGGHTQYYAERAVAKQVLLAAGIAGGCGRATDAVRGATTISANDNTPVVDAIQEAPASLTHDVS